MFKINNRNTRTRRELRSKLTIETPDISPNISSVSIVNFEHVIAGWVCTSGDPLFTRRK